MVTKGTKQVKYDKVWWKRTVSFPGSVLSYVFKIVEIDEKFYIYINDSYPNLRYDGETGPFKSYEKAFAILKEDLGSNFPSLKRTFKKIARISLVILFYIAFIALNLLLFVFLDGGLNAIGIQKTYFLIIILLFIFNAFTITKLDKVAKEIEKRLR